MIRRKAKSQTIGPLLPSLIVARGPTSFGNSGSQLFDADQGDGPGCANADG